MSAPATRAEFHRETSGIRAELAAIRGHFRVIKITMAVGFPVLSAQLAVIVAKLFFGV